MRYLLIGFTLFVISFSSGNLHAQSWIRINQLGYTPGGIKVAVFVSQENTVPSGWQLVEVQSGKAVAAGKPGQEMGAYGPFRQTTRLNFSSFVQPGHYYLQADDTRSPVFCISDTVYKGAADFCLRYMRQQRSGFNPFLKDSCHTQDGYVLYGKNAGIADSSFIDVSGGWHDASDYLQYSSTSANATYHLLAAWRDFPEVFTDTKQANGLEGKNGRADVLDEARWGLDWLLKMHPEPGIMFNQLGDDRDHISMRIPKMDSQYGRGYQRPVYFLSGEPQQRGKFMNNTTGTSSTAAKFSSAFGLGARVFRPTDSVYAKKLASHSLSAIDFAAEKPGVSQTASVRSPYIYAEENWADDMELGYAVLYQTPGGFLNYQTEGLIRKYRDSAYTYAKREPLTPWLGADTARHYQWYPFINPGHAELAAILKNKQRDTVIQFYKEGIEKVEAKAKQNAFLRGIPYIWCSNNLTVSFAIQCYWYRQLNGDNRFAELEQANFDWLFGCNPWGTSMVYGLPANGDTPEDPHSAFTHLKNYPVDGGLVDGPVYGSIYKSLIGIQLYQPDEYAAFQSELAVYHDDYGDYSTNEPTMDGTASLIYLLAAHEAAAKKTVAQKSFHYQHGAIIRGDTTKKEMALVFTAHEFAEGGAFIRNLLKKEKIKASFFLTGDFLRQPSFRPLVRRLQEDGHYLGPHSDKHLLYCDWKNRDSLLVSRTAFEEDLQNNLKLIPPNTGTALYFLPPYEWYNDSIAHWAATGGFQLINYTPGTLTHADYTTNAAKNYRDSKTILASVYNYEENNPSGLNGFILLLHAGAGPGRTDKFYKQLPALLKWLQQKGYRLRRVDELLGANNYR